MNTLGRSNGIAKIVELNVRPHYNKISWTNSNPYNKRCFSRLKINIKGNSNGSHHITPTPEIINKNLQM